MSGFFKHLNLPALFPIHLNLPTLPSNDIIESRVKEFFEDLVEIITDPFKNAYTSSASLISRAQQTLSQKHPQTEEKKTLRIKIPLINVTFEFGSPSLEIDENSIVSDISLVDQALQVALDTFSEIRTSISSMLSREETQNILLFQDDDPNGQKEHYLN